MVIVETIALVVGEVTKTIALGRSAKKVIDWARERPANRKMREAGELVDDIREFAIAEYMNMRERDAEDVEVFEAAIARMLADYQFERMQRNLEFEAVREATDERREMLAFAAAGLCDPQMSINKKARIERTLRGLDPEDILCLREMAAGGPTVTVESIAGGRPVSFAALVSSGCLLYDSGGTITWGGSAGSRVVVSGIGELVLRVLKDYPISEDP